MAPRKKKRKKKIRTLQDIKGEKEKLRVALDYTEQAIQEDLDEAREAIQPSNITQVVDNALPVIGKFLPVGKLAFQVLPDLFSGRGNKRKSKEEDDEREEEPEIKSSWGRKFKKGMVKTLVPFLIGTLATAGGIFYRSSRKASNKEH